jgi:glutathione S-transferase
MLTLYHGRTSVCSIKARLALAEKGVAFESRLMTLRGDQFEPGYMKLNPNAVVPTLVHDGRVVIESTVIMHYVDEAFGGAALMPSDPLARAQARMTEKLMDEHVHVSCMTITFATANRASLAKLAPREMEEELAKAPDPARSEIKRQVVTYGLDAAPVAQALRQQEKPSRRWGRVAISPDRTGRWRMPRRPLMSGGSTSSSWRACGTTGLALPPGTNAFASGRRSERRWRTG